MKPSRPFGLTELDLILDSEMRFVPPAPVEIPILYPVLNEESTTQIARECNSAEAHLARCVSEDWRSRAQISGQELKTMKAEIYKDEGYKLMGAAYEVYNEQGYGMAEEIYQESLEIELELRGIPFSSKQELSCFCKGRELKKRYVPDLFVFDCLVVELKAVTQLFPEHEAQLINYMRITKQPVGYLMNFGHKDTLKWKRFILSELVSGSKD